MMCFLYWYLDYVDSPETPIGRTMILLMWSPGTC